MPSCQQIKPIYSAHPGVAPTHTGEICHLMPKIGYVPRRSTIRGVSLRSATVLCAHLIVAQIQIVGVHTMQARHQIAAIFRATIGIAPNVYFMGTNTVALFVRGILTVAPPSIRLIQMKMGSFWMVRWIRLMFGLVHPKTGTVIYSAASDLVDPTASRILYNGPLGRWIPAVVDTG